MFYVHFLYGGLPSYLFTLPASDSSGFFAVPNSTLFGFGSFWPHTLSIIVIRLNGNNYA